MPGYQTGPDNRLVSDGTYNYTYDNEGNTLTRTRISDGQVTTFTWDYRNRLTEAVVRDAQGNVLDDEKFTYDANDHRIGVWANGAQQSWTVYDGDTPYLDFTGTGAVSERYLADPRAIDAFFAREDGTGNVAWLLTDKLGSVREVVNSGGNVLDAITYDSYGNILNETNAAAGGPFRFTAGAYDSTLGLTYLWHRWYANGHWLSEDPEGFAAGDTNLGRYAGNSPLAHRDPTGLDWKDDSIKKIMSRLGSELDPGKPTLITEPTLKNRALKMGSHISDKLFNEAVEKLGKDIIKTTFAAINLAEKGFDWMGLVKDAAKEGAKRGYDYFKDKLTKNSIEVRRFGFTLDNGGQKCKASVTLLWNFKTGEFVAIYEGSVGSEIEVLGQNYARLTGKGRIEQFTFIVTGKAPEGKLTEGPRYQWIKPR